MNRILILLLSFIIMGCQSGGSFSPNTEGSRLVEKEAAKVKEKFNYALALMDSKEFNKAGRAFKKILRDHPTSELELLIVYNMGGALEGLGRCKAASKRYREVRDKSEKGQGRLKAQAMLRLSYVYECSNEDAKVIATLLSLERMSDALPINIIKAEVPARLAAAYARQGNQSLAQKYFNNARDGLKKLNSSRRNPEKKKTLLAKTLYYMGSMNKYDINKLSGATYIDSLKYLQNYLLMSVELGHNDWSPRSAREILDSYDKIYVYVNALPVDPRPEHKFSSRQIKMREIEAALVSIYNLKQQRLPEDAEIKIVEQLYSHIEAKESKFKIALAKISHGTELTPEAIKRQSLKQPGRVLSKETILENRTQKKTKQ